MRFLTGHRHAIRALAYAPGTDNLLVSAGDDRQVRFWNPAVGEAAEPLTAHGDSLVCLAFSPDGTLLASGGRSGSVAVWSVGERRLLQSISGFVGPVVALGFAGDNREIRMALSSPTYREREERVFHWDLRSERPRPEPLPWEGDLESAAFASELVALADLDRRVVVGPFGHPPGPPLASMSGRVRCLAFCPATRYLALGTGRFVELWDITERRPTAVLAGHRGTVQALAFHPSGKELLTGGVDRMVLRWEVLTGRHRDGWEWPVGSINALAVAPDGLTAAVGGDKSTVVVWDLDEE
jgi:WD40 repeat protein